MLGLELPELNLQPYELAVPYHPRGLQKGLSGTQLAGLELPGAESVQQEVRPSDEVAGGDDGAQRLLCCTAVDLFRQNKMHRRPHDWRRTSGDGRDSQEWYAGTAPAGAAGTGGGAAGIAAATSKPAAVPASSTAAAALADGSSAAAPSSAALLIRRRGCPSAFTRGGCPSGGTPRGRCGSSSRRARRRCQFPNQSAKRCTRTCHRCSDRESPRPARERSSPSSKWEQA